MVDEITPATTPESIASEITGSAFSFDDNPLGEFLAESHAQSDDPDDRALKSLPPGAKPLETPEPVVAKTDAPAEPVKVEGGVVGEAPVGEVKEPDAVPTFKQSDIALIMEAGRLGLTETDVAKLPELIEARHTAIESEATAQRREKFTEEATKTATQATLGMLDPIVRAKMRGEADDEGYAKWNVDLANTDWSLPENAAQLQRYQELMTIENAAPNWQAYTKGLVNTDVAKFDASEAKFSALYAEAPNVPKDFIRYLRGNGATPEAIQNLTKVTEASVQYATSTLNSENATLRQENETLKAANSGHQAALDAATAEGKKQALLERTAQENNPVTGGIGGNSQAEDPLDFGKDGQSMGTLISDLMSDWHKDTFTTASRS